MSLHLKLYVHKYGLFLQKLTAQEVLCEELRHRSCKHSCSSERIDSTKAERHISLQTSIREKLYPFQFSLLIPLSFKGAHRHGALILKVCNLQIQRNQKL